MPQPAFKNIDYTSQGRLSVTTVGFGFDTIEDVKNKKLSSHYCCLDGEWDFKLYDSIYSLPDSIELLKDFGGDKIAVPSDWQFSHSKYSWMTSDYNPRTDGITPPDRINEVGVYHKIIDITTTMLERELYLQMDGVGSAAEIYLNGCYIGFCQSAYDGHRFCIAEFAVIGENHLTVIVYRYSHGTCLEDRSSYRLSGLFRSVWLCGAPIFAVDDVGIVTELSPNNDIGILKVDTDVRINAKREQIELWSILYNSKKEVVARAQEIVFSVAPTLQPIRIEQQLSVEKPKLWSDESPELYHLVLFLQDNLGNTLDMRRVEFGFRQLSVTQDDKILTLNGKPLKLFGARYEEWHPDYGRTLPYELLLKDIHLIKRCNLNTIYLDHPASDMLYEICDRIGVFIMSDIHTIPDDLRRNNADLVPFVAERLQSMIKRLRCHPSVISWGIEEFDDKTFKQLVEICEALDVSRPIGGKDFTSISVGNLSTLIKANRKKHTGQEQLPIIAKEFADVNGNALGEFKEHVEAVRENERIAGGLIANFIMTAGWNGHDFHIINPNGILQPDRTPNPTAFELKHCLSPVSLSLDKDFLTLTNLYRSKIIKKHFVVWELRLDGLGRETGIINLPEVQPGESRKISIPYPLINTDKAVDLVVNLCDNSNLEWSDPDRVICSSHHRLAQRNEPAPKNFAQLIEEQDVYTFNQNGCRYTIDKQTGFLISANEDDFEFMGAPLQPQIARARVGEEGDKGSLLLNSVKRIFKIGFWQEAENNISLKRLSAEPDTLLAEFTASGIRKMFIAYRCSIDGELLVEFSVTPSQSADRLGITFDAAKQLSQLACFCMGPDENYCNRNNANLPVLLQGDREELCHHYLLPQENGNRTGAEWLMLYGKHQDKNPVILIKTLDRPVDISVHPYSKQSLTQAQNLASLSISDCLTVNVDAVNSGIGVDTNTIILTKSPYRPAPNRMYSMELCIKISRR